MTLPHIEQKNNTNQLTLQLIGNIPYQQGKSATSYDSINSLTTPNKHYTLLYPDLVQELLDFTLHNNNSSKNKVSFLSNLGENNTKSSSLNSLLSSSLGSVDSSLSPRDIFFFLQIVSLYQLELSKGNSSITYPSMKLAKLLGVDVSCDTAHLNFNTSSNLISTSSTNSFSTSTMRATILKMTSKLESLGLLKVFRRKRKNGMDMANKLIPVLPDKLHARLKDSPSNLKVSDSSKLDHESNLEHILRTKLFVPIELEFMKSLFKDSIPSKYKLFFLNCIMSAYRSFRNNANGGAEEDTLDIPNMLSFSSTSLELMKKNNISYSTLKRIFKYIKQQGDSFFLQVEHKYIKSDDIDSNRYDKSIFVISINPLVFPIFQKGQSKKEEISNFNCDELIDDELPILPDTYEGFKTGGSKKQPRSVTKAALNNKEEIIKNKYSRNIDYIDEKSEEEFLEEEQSSSSSKSYNNSSFLDISSSRNRRNISEQKKEWLELRHFYPLSEKDISLLNSRANREFSNNFMNQLLLKLYIKYPEKRFKNKFTFLSYMEKILKNEKHQGPLVNHTSFRFSCNISTPEKNLLGYEKYLNQIEGSFDTSKEMQVRKKIAGRYSSEIAYKILTSVEFKTNQDNSFITALIPSQLDLGGIQTESLSKRQIVILSEQLEAVYGINRYYVQEVEQEVIQLPKSRTSDIASAGKSIGISRQSKELDTTSENAAWHQIRKGLREELGEQIDKAWFSKAVATECKKTKTLTLTMPTRFMSDWVRNNYSHVIRRLSERCGINRVEYGY